MAEATAVPQDQPKEQTTAVEEPKMHEQEVITLGHVNENQKVMMEALKETLEQVKGINAALEEIKRWARAGKF